MNTRSILASLVLAASLPAASLPASAASIDLYSLNLPGPDSLAFIIDSVAASSAAGTFSRFRVSDRTSSSMGSDVVANTNLVALGNVMWFTTRNAPYRVGSANLSTISGNPVYYTPPGFAFPYSDMVVGPDGALWATSAQSNRIARLTQSGAIAVLTGNGTIYPAGITRGGDGNLWFADPTNRRITRINPSTLVFTDFAVPQVSATTIPERITGVGTQDGRLWFATQDGFGSVDPATGAIATVATEAQAPRRIAAAPDGTIWLTNGTPFVTQFTPPANYAKLQVFTAGSAQSAGLYIDTDGTVYVGDASTALLARIAVAQATASDTTVVEFFNTTLNHYFVTANAGEATAIDNGAAGPGWTRTGQTWKAWIKGPIPLAAEVCRFYGSTAINPATGQRRGPNSHFYTLDPGECAAVKTDLGWTYEAPNKFWLVKPTGAGASKTCPTWTEPVYRVYNNRFAQNDSNHRYMVSTSLYSQMLAAGWLGEGVVMCAPLA